MRAPLVAAAVVARLAGEEVLVGLVVDAQQRGQPFRARAGDRDDLAAGTRDQDLAGLGDPDVKGSITPTRWCPAACS